jgi:RIO kinase 1
MWAEKEMRNYRRLELAGVPCPAPLLLREHVLLMQFVGHDGFAAPRLKDAHLSDAHADDAAVQVMLLLRHIYQRARLVHADFSEFNLLWYKQRVVVIDVSQAMKCRMRMLRCAAYAHATCRRQRMLRYPMLC